MIIHNSYVSLTGGYLQGSWQIPLHMTGPSREDPIFHGASLKEAPRVTCSSLLIRILSMGAARAALRRKTPSYTDRQAAKSMSCLERFQICCILPATSGCWLHCRANYSSLDLPNSTERHAYTVVLAQQAVCADVLYTAVSDS